MMLKYQAVSMATKFGVAIAMTTDKADLQQLLAELRPVSTKVPLIRMGCDHDGGYLVPDDLEGIAACFSPGVDNRATFEEQLISRGIRCHLADASIEKSPLTDPDSTFLRKFVDVVDSDTTIRIDRWIDDLEPGDSDLLMQMDIEGAEWPVLLNISDRNLARFRVLVLEFHDMERLFDKHAFLIIQAVMKRLTAMFRVVHLHPNNTGGLVRMGDIEVPRALELTLLRRDRAEADGFVTTFPHPLDRVNDRRIKDVVLPASRHAG